MSKLSTVFEHHLARTAAIVLIAAPALAGCASTNPASPEKRIERLDKNAMQSAVADGVSTGLALSAGGLEANPLAATSPLGIVALTGAKIGLVKFADTLPENEKRLVIKTTSAVWGGAAINNLMVMMSAAPAVAIGAGVVAGVMWWVHSTKVYDQADREIAAREEKLQQKTDQPMVAAAR